MSKSCGSKQWAYITVHESFVLRWTAFLGSFMCLWSDLGEASSLLSIYEFVDNPEKGFHLEHDPWFATNFLFSLLSLINCSCVWFVIDCVEDLRYPCAELEIPIILCTKIGHSLLQKKGLEFRKMPYIVCLLLLFMR